MASLRGESSNQLLETLEEWNDYLERYSAPPTGDSEIKLFGQQITDALKFAGIIVKIGDPKLSLPWSGVSVILPGAATKINEDPVVSIFTKSGIASFAGHAKQTPLGDISLDTPMIFVGRKDVSPPHPPGAAITEGHDIVTASGTIKRN